MSNLQLTRDAHYALERLLKKTIQENRANAVRYPTLAVKLVKEADEYDQALQQLLRTPLLSAPRPSRSNTDNRIPEYARPKFKVAS